MEQELKRLSPEGVPAALEKAERYRLLNEPEAAESICLDILAVEPANNRALIGLLLARTDQLGRGDPKRLHRAREVLPKLEDDYQRAYYGGVICERQAKTLLRQRGRHSNVVAHEWFRYAMEQYEIAIGIHPPGNDEAILRWNTCVRLIRRHRLRPPDPDEPISLGIE